MQTKGERQLLRSSFESYPNVRVETVDAILVVGAQAGWKPEDVCVSGTVKDSVKVIGEMLLKARTDPLGYLTADDS